jgi:hypothetical protein
VKVKSFLATGGLALALSVALPLTSYAQQSTTPQQPADAAAAAPDQANPPAPAEQNREPDPARDANGNDRDRTIDRADQNRPADANDATRGSVGTSGVMQDRQGTTAGQSDRQGTTAGQSGAAGTSGRAAQDPGATANRQSLPNTASPIPFMALGALGALAGAGALRLRRK